MKKSTKVTILIVVLAVAAVLVLRHFGIDLFRSYATGVVDR